MDEASGLLDADEAERLERACRTTIGDGLRSITYFTPEQYEQLYLRSDLEADADLAGFVENESTAFHERAGYHGSELGEHQYTIRVFDAGFLISVIAGDRGTFATTGGLTVNRSRDAATAIGDVLDALDGE